MVKDKQKLRRFYRSKRKNLTADAEQVAELFFSDRQSLIFDHSNTQPCIAGYYPTKNEISPLGVLARAEKAALPIIQDTSKILVFAKWQDGDALVKSNLGILEPEGREIFTPDIIIIPLLAFDKTGTRLGQGGGYYDATLAFVRAQGNITAVGLAFDEQEAQDLLPCEAHDQRLDAVLTPTRLIKF